MRFKYVNSTPPARYPISIRKGGVAQDQVIRQSTAVLCHGLPRSAGSKAYHSPSSVCTTSPPVYFCVGPMFDGYMCSAEDVQFNVSVFQRSHLSVCRDVTRCGNADPTRETKIQGVYRGEMVDPLISRTRPAEGELSLIHI